MRGDAVQAIERFAGELAAADAFAGPQVGALTVANEWRRELAGRVRGGTRPDAAWWLGPRSECPIDVTASRRLTADESVHVSTCERCREDQRRAVLLGDLFEERAGAHPATATHLRTCAECTALDEGLRAVEALARELDHAEDVALSLFNKPLSAPLRVEIERKRDQPRAHVAEVTGTIDGRDCRGRVVVVPDGPVGAATELSLVVHDALGPLRGRPVRIEWKDGGLLAEGKFQRDFEASLPLLPSVVAQLAGRVLQSALFTAVLSFDVGRV